MIYNFNLGIGWASSGVEYAQSYRANIFRRIGQPARFVFTDMFSQENIEHMTKNIGFDDEEIIWLYTFFSDIRIAPVTYTLADLEKTLTREYTFSREGKTAKYTFGSEADFYRVYLVNEESDRVHRVEMVSKGCLIRKDYYTYTRIYSEYYAPYDGKAHLYQRRFFNEDQTVAYDEIIDEDKAMYVFKDRKLCSKEELVAYMVQSLNLTEKDIVIVDRSTGIGQSILQNVKPAKVGNVIHADHFSEPNTNDDFILWNNYYEYTFSLCRDIDFYVTATEVQKELLEKQFEKYEGVKPEIFAIPVGSIDELKIPQKPRRKHNLVTASRLASEKHLDWVIEAVVKAKKSVPDITLDIYGKGGEEELLKNKISHNQASEYIHLMGHHDLSDVYMNYDAYISGSTSEGFGLTLLEAIGSGLPIVGFDVRYGNKTFTDHGQNGLLIDISDDMSSKEKIDKLAEKIVEMFTQADMESWHNHSYEKAKQFLTSEVEKKWVQLINQMT